jgi:Fanconi anemia group M protein
MHTLIVDSRETNSGIMQRLSSLGTVFERRELPYGDFQIGNILIERKRDQDFEASIKDGRLFGQIEIMASNSDNPVLIIEGDLSSVGAGLHVDSIPGALSAIAVYWPGFKIIPTIDNMATARLLSRMLKHMTEGLGYEIPLRVAKPTAKHDGSQVQYLVEGLPGVGPLVARKLITHFGSARKVFCASVEELCSVKGIGEKTAIAIVNALEASPTSFNSTKNSPILP